VTESGPADEVDVAAVQRQAWANKLAKGFNTTDVALEFGLLTAEVSEAFTAWRRGLPDFGEELADVLIYLGGLAEMTGVDLAAEVRRKLLVNEARQYRRDSRGALHRLPAGSPDPQALRAGDDS
jgi:NTP pyrophosphatase (non-canonical NTP hydrolase)